LRADLVLMDDRAGVAIAKAHGFVVTGTLGVLELAARRKLIDLAGTVRRLKATNFRCRPEILDALLARHG
jgi:predicted nucleic acid-binding protein